MNDWIKDAACKGMDPNLFLPHRGEALGPVKVVCAGCCVRAECRQFGLDHLWTRGVWGGLSERERRQVRAMRRAAA